MNQHRVSTLMWCAASLAALAGCGTTEATRIERVSVTQVKADELRDEWNRLITVCLDGTWNVPSSDTNVWQFHQLAKASEGNVIAYYTEGVGTTLATSKSGGKLGHGVDSRISDAYEFLCETWKPGDRLVLVGFSRGAYQARLLAGIIDTFGIHYGGPRRSLSEEEEEGQVRLLKNLLEIFPGQLSDEAISEPSPPDSAVFRSRCKAFHDMHKRPGITVPRDIHGGEHDPTRWYAATVHTLVCFDTVAAVAPIGRVLSATLQNYPPPPPGFTRLYPSTKLALHAMALDEDREAFRVVPFSGIPFEGAVREVWFAGAHSDIGGGYEHCGSNHVALAWALENLPADLHAQLGSPEPPVPMPRLHREDASFWKRERRSRVEGSSAHPSVKDRIQRDPSYRPNVGWWSTGDRE